MFRDVWRWAQWEFDREIEVGPVIRLITIERFCKGGLLLVGGLALLLAGERANVHDLVVRAHEELNFQPGSAWWSSLFNRLLTRLGTLKASTATLIALGAMAYGALEVFEGVGLVLRKRWAEYVVVIATAAFIPLEVDELIRHATPIKAGGSALNIAIVVYLVWRKRLFIERPGDEPPPGQPVPADG